MKTKSTCFLMILLMFIAVSVNAQRRAESGKNYNGLNLGIGIGGYYGYAAYNNRALPVFTINYEFGVARNFTLAPFATFYTYQADHYRESVIPIGAKGTYYFDDLLDAGSSLDFYLAGSVGFVLVNSTWDTDYNGDKTYYNKTGPLFLDLHIGTEYHVNNKIGLFLDFSTGVSTVGLAIH